MPALCYSINHRLAVPGTGLRPTEERLPWAGAIRTLALSGAGMQRPLHQKDQQRRAFCLFPVQHRGLLSPGFISPVLIESHSGCPNLILPIVFYKHPILPVFYDCKIAGISEKQLITGYTFSL